jgi:hypothetical protein
MSTQYKILIGDTDANGGDGEIRVPATGDDSYLAPATLDAATGNEVAFDIAYTVNKASSGNDTGLLVTMTDTASPGTSLLANLVTGATTQFNVSNAGATYIGGDITLFNTNADYFITTASDELVIIGKQGTRFTHNEDTTDGTVFLFAPEDSGDEITASSGTQNFVSITPDINQSGTAGATDLHINRTETGTGSGTQNFIDCQVATSSKFTVDNTGLITVGRYTESFIIAASDETSDLTVADDKVNFRMPYAFTLSEIPRASVNTAPTGATITVDIEEAGSTIFSTLLTIDAGETTSTTAATPAVLSDSSLADDAIISINVDQIGSGTAGAGLKITLIGYQT